MKKILLVSLLALALALIVFSLLPAKVSSVELSAMRVTAAPLPEIQEPSIKEKLIQGDATVRLQIVESLVKAKAEQYNVNAYEMLTTIRCENKSLDPNKQSGHRYNFNSPKRKIVLGEQERSFGLVMIHLPDHPTVSHTEATDPEFAIDFMAKKFANGEQRAWTCWRTHFE